MSTASCGAEVKSSPSCTCNAQPTSRIAQLGLWMRRHRGTILAAQWTVVLFYVVMVALPVFLPLPGEDDHILDNLTRFAQFLFWGIWWPFVILSVMALGRVWCGVFCPEGALSEWSSRFGLGLPVPRWLKWAGWPFLAFILTTVYGQMTSVYEYPKPTLLILGGSTLAAIVVGFIYGRGKRVWCRHLCPVSGVFGLLAKVAPVHFAVNRRAWDSATDRGQPVNCAPLIDIRRMQSASNCHMCGRCAGQRGAVDLALRSPAAEILSLPAQIWPARLLVFGMLGVALGAFQWSSSPWFVAIKLKVAAWLIEHEIWWALDTPGHWWLFTHYPEMNDVFTWLDAGMLLAYIGATALVVGGWIRLCLGWTRLVMALIPFAGASVFVGLSLLTTSQLFGEGIVLAWANTARLVLLGLAGLWSTTLAWRLGRWRAAIGMALAVALPSWAWYQQLFIW